MGSNSTGRAAPAAARSQRIPPHNLVAEEALLGALLLSRDAIADVVETVKASHFYRRAHAAVFDVVYRLYGEDQPADAVTVAAALESTDPEALAAVGGLGGLLGFQMNTPATSNAASYAGIVRDTYLLRCLISAGAEMVEAGYSRPEDALKTIDWAESLVYRLAQHHTVDKTASISDLLLETLDRLEDRYRRGGDITGTPTGYRDLDRLLLGLQPSSLYVVGGRPSMGKTSFALGMASHAALVVQRPVLMFSLEMAHSEVTNRLLCSEGRIDASRVASGNLTDADWDIVNTTCQRFAAAPLWVDDDASATVMEMRAKARRLKSRVGDLALVLVDYLQLMTGRQQAESRQVEIAEISRGLKVLARELDCPVVALSQLSRNPEMRQEKRPMLSDLRESGAIEQDADVVMFIYRDEVYNPDNIKTAGVAEVIIAKNRNGPTATTTLTFLPRFVAFKDFASSAL